MKNYRSAVAKSRKGRMGKMHLAKRRANITPIDSKQKTWGLTK